MDIHDEISIGYSMNCLRVAGGWIYINYPDEGSPTMVFVPYDNEYEGCHNDR